MESHTDLTYAVEVILQFFKEQNLLRSFQALTEEAQVPYAQISCKAEFIDNVRKGFWHQVLKQIQFVRVDRSVLAQLYAQIVKELLMAKETDLAQLVIKEQTMDVLQDFPDLLQ